MKNKNKQLNRTTYLLFIASFLSVVALTLSGYTLMRLQNFDKASMEHGQNLATEIARTRFCLDQKVIPCDDTNIKKWNESHPGGTFNVVR